MNYLAEEADVKNIVLDFMKFCDFIESHKPKATAAGVLSPKTCYEINQLLNYPEKKAKPTDRLHKYASVSMWFYIAQEAGLIVLEDISWNREVYHIADSYEDFKKMSVFSQYMLIFFTWCCFVNPEENYNEKGTKHVFVKLFDDVFAEFGQYGSSEWINYDENNNSAIQTMMKNCYKAANNLMNLGLLDFTGSKEVSKYFNTPIIEKIKATNFGCHMMKVCKFSEFNGYLAIDPDEAAIKEATGEIDKILSAIEKKHEEFFTLFSSYFPQNSIDIKTIDSIVYGYCDTDDVGDADYIIDADYIGGAGGNDKVTFEFKVSLKKNCYRIIRCSSEHTFEDLHLAIQQAFNFDNDHLYSFFLDARPFSNHAVNAPFSEAPPYTDEVCLKDARLYNNQRILYLFDYGDEWHFDVTVNVIPDIDASLKNPKIIKAVGKAPRQY